MNAPNPNTRVRVLHDDPFTIPPAPAPWARPVSRPRGVAITAALSLLLWAAIIGGAMWAFGDAPTVDAVKAGGGL